MEISNEMQDETLRLTQGDLAIAAYALAETFNSYLERYDEDDYGELTKEQMESSLESLRIAFTKFDSISKVLSEQSQQTMEENNAESMD